MVLITGASSGLGESLAHCFYDQGCKVILAARRKEQLDKVKNDILSKKMVSSNPIIIINVVFFERHRSDTAYTQLV